jgi:hypothetical protein
MKNVAKSISSQFGLSSIIAQILSYSPTPDTLAYMVLTGIVGKPPMEATSKSIWLDKLMDMMEEMVVSDKPSGISRCFYGFPNHGFGIKVDFSTYGDRRQSLTEAICWENMEKEYKRYFCPILTYFSGKHGPRNEKTKTGRAGKGKVVRTGRYILSVVPFCTTKCLTSQEMSNLKDAVRNLGICDIHEGNVGKLQGIPVVLDYGL